MVTLKQLFQTFGHDPKWARFATASAQPMVSVFFRKLGDRDITTLTDFDIQLQLAMSEQPEDRKVKARACIDHLRTWAAEQGKPFAQPEPEPSKAKKEKPKPKLKAEKPKAASKPKAEPTSNDSPQGRRSSTGTIYHDNASKGYSASGKRVFHDCWRAEIVIAGQRFRHRSKDRDDCVAWLRAVTSKKIKPTDNKADWWRMEQRKDEAVRIDEIIVNQAEEAVMLYDYHQSHDLAVISDYVIKRLLPHMVYYCAHTLNIGRQSTQTASKQAIALLLTRIIQGRPVANFTNSCKRMLRTYKQRGDFFYYETKAPKDVRLLVNNIDMSALEDLYKVTKDRRI